MYREPGATGWSKSLRENMRERSEKWRKNWHVNRNFWRARHILPCVASRSCRIDISWGGREALKLHHVSHPYGATFRLSTVPHIDIAWCHVIKSVGRSRPQSCHVAHSGAITSSYMGKIQNLQKNHMFGIQAHFRRSLYPQFQIDEYYNIHLDFVG